MNRKLPAALRLYRLLSTASRPLARVALAVRVRRGKEDRPRLAERRGETNIARPSGPLVWIHGASVGELVSTLPLIGLISARGIHVLVSSGTVTSSRIAAQRLPAGTIHQFAPLDIPIFVRRFFDHWRPDLALFVESDLWPNRMMEASRRHIPMILVNGRLSERSYYRWHYLPATIVNLLQRLDLCLVGTARDAARLNALGAPRVITTGNLKIDVPAPPCDEHKLADLRAAIRQRPVFAAASTHEGEESAIIEACRQLRPQFPGLLLLIAPRHPERGPGIANLADRAGLHAKLRSRGDFPDVATDVYITDTLGELGLVYRLAPVVFMGGSLVRHGGQNPIEAAKLGVAIVHGPHVWNFADIYAALDEAHGAEQVADADGLTAGLGTLMADPNARTRLTQMAREAVKGLGGALERTLVSLEPYLLQLRLGQRAHDA